MSNSYKTIHVVKNGESFGSIAEIDKYDVDYHKLKAFNKDRGETRVFSTFSTRNPPYGVDVGDKIYIPYSEEEKKEIRKQELKKLKEHARKKEAEKKQREQQKIKKHLAKPTTPYAPASPVQGCSAADTSLDPCDIAKLTIHDSKSKRSVSCTTKATKDKSLSAKDRKKLGSHDLLIECMADFENNYGIDPKKKVDIGIQAINKPAHHIDLDVAFTKNKDGLDQDQTYVTGSAEIKGILAPSIRSGANSRNRKQSWVSRLWNFNDLEKIIKINADSCGIIYTGMYPNKNLTARVVIYPNQNYGLSLKIPSFKTIKKSVKGSISVERQGFSSKGVIVESQSSRSSSSMFGREGEESSSSRSRNSSTGTDVRSKSYKVTSGGHSLEEINSTGTKDSKTHVSNKNIETKKTGSLLGGAVYTDESSDKGLSSSKSKKIELRPNFSITLNDQELKVTSSINNILDIANKIKETWNSIQNFVPKVGWSASLDIAILEGSVNAKWGYIESQKTTKRIATVEPYYSLDINTKLIEMTFAAQFGIEHSVDNWFSSGKIFELILKVYGKSVLLANLNAKLSSGDHDKKPIEVKGRATGEIGGHAKAQLLDYVYEAKVYVGGGFIVSGTLKCDFNQSPNINTKVAIEDMAINIRLYRADKPPYRPKPIMIYKGRDIYNGIIEL